ncbi:MAG: hypothetical protein NZ570_06350 [Candidatus Caldarchaeum sp.]|nr:hypothetical protein [Candidatus Caldarchaeum sp.]MCS7137563.1 hypothetical protein [Candidatus Caldarchaeum sp.]MDW7977852.1 hypothetical protein [Candidatus Caldarchaeum sp.]MDW8360065.1 hypothetical protein [Candidatus Caldarchaeum sp.]
MIQEVVVENVEGEYPFKVFRGRVVWRGIAARFEGVVYQSVGGPNVSASVVEEDLDALVKQGVSKEELASLQLELQQKILNGEVKIDGG